MGSTLRELAELVGGECFGDPDLPIQAARPLHDAGTGDITFIEDEKHAHRLQGCKASAVVASKALRPAGIAVIQVADPLDAFVAIVRKMHGLPKAAPTGIDSRAAVHPTATVGPNSSLHPFAVIGEWSSVGSACTLHSGVVVGRYCKLGHGVTLHPHVVLYDGTILGDNVVIHANAVIGADGFGYRFQGGKQVKVPQQGHVEIADDVEIGAGTTIDRGSFEATRIGLGTKIDNLVQIGHNVRLGKHNLIVSQVGIAGSTTTGDYVVIAGQAGLVDHVHIGDGATIGAQSGVTKEVPAGTRYLGSPATPEREQKRILMTLERLPEIRKDIQRIKQHLGLPDEQRKTG